MMMNEAALGEPLTPSAGLHALGTWAAPGPEVPGIDQGQLLASIAATSNDCILSLDVEGTILWASPATVDVLGWRPEEIAGHGVAVIAPRDGADVHAVHLDRLLAGEPVEPFVDTGVRRDGSTFKASVTLGPVHDGSGEVTGVVVILRDVTAELSERREVAQALAASWAHFEQVSTPQALLDLDGRLVSVNPAWCELFGHDETYFVRCDVLSLVHPMDLRKAGDLLGSLRGGERESVSYRGIFRDAGGRSLSLLVDATLLRHPDGTPYAVAASARDLDVVGEARRTAAVQNSLYDALGRRAWHVAVVLDPESLSISYITPSVMEMLGYDPREVLLTDGWSYVHPADKALLSQMRERVVAAPHSAEQFTIRLRGRDGGWRWIEETLTNCVHDPDINGLVATLRDVTERVETEEALRLSESLHRAMVETAQEGILAMSPVGVTIFANETAAGVLGVPVGDMLGRPTLELLGLDEGTPCGRFTLRYARPDGAQRMLEVACSELAGDQPHPLGSLLMVSDVTEAREAEIRLRRQALHDSLTGLPNRYLFEDRLQTAAARQERNPGQGTAVLFLDLDRFKPINDGLGHQAGDEVLRLVATRLAASVRTTDTVGRWGGDEFAIICEDTDEAAAVLVAARILSALRQPVECDEELLLSVSIGIAVSPPHPFGELVRRADGAMYRAKHLGGGRIAVARPDDAPGPEDQPVVTS